MPVDPIAGLPADEIIRVLDLQPHPEGGYFRETFRDPAQDSRGRAVSTDTAVEIDVSRLEPGEERTPRGFNPHERVGFQDRVTT